MATDRVGRSAPAAAGGRRKPAVGGRFSIVAVAIASVMLAAPAAARDIAKNDLDMAGHTLVGLPAPGGVDSAAVPLSSVAVCTGITKWTGVNGTSSCATPNIDYLTPSFTLGGDLSGTPGAANVIGIRETGGPTHLTFGAIPDTYVLQRQGGALVGQVLSTSSLTDGIATWNPSGVRVFCVDSSAPDDSALGYADSADATQANVAAATVTCGGVAKKTIEGVCAVIPQVGNGRVAHIVINAGTYAESLRCLGKIRDMTVVVRGTGTNSTAGATKFTGTTADLTHEGAQTCSGMNAAGYNPATSTTSATLQLVKVGGGGPGFPVETAKPLYCRLRFDNATGTTADRNAVASIVKVTASDTVVMDRALTYTTSDVLYFEEPGVLITATVPALTLRAGTFVLNGLQISSANIQAIGGNVSQAFVHGGGVAISFGGQLTTSTASSVAPGPTIGPSRFTGVVSVSQGNASLGRSSVFFGSTGTFTNPLALSILDNDVIVGNVSISGGSGNNLIGGTGSTTPARMFGTLSLQNVTGNVGYIDMPSTSAAYGLIVTQDSDLIFGGVVSGGTKTDAGMSFSNAYQSRIRFFTGIQSTVTGTNGDTHWGLSGTANVAQNAYFSWAGLYFDIGQRSTSYMFPNGTILTVGTVDSNAGMHSGQPRMLTAVQNYGTGVTITPGQILRFVLTDGIGAVLAQADSTANLVGTLGIAADYIPNLKSSFAVLGQQMYAQPESGTFHTDGGNIAYVSAAVAGAYTTTKPALARIIGWTVGESTIQLQPDHLLMPVSRIYSAGTAQNVEQGLNFPSTFSFSDNTGAGRLDVTVPAWLVDPVSNGILARTSSTATAARTLTAGGGGSIVITNGDGVSGNPTFTRAALIGDIGAGADSNTTTIAGHAVSNAKFRQSGPSTLVGNPTGGTADVTDIPLGAGCSFVAGALTCPGAGVPTSRTLTPDIGILIDGGTSPVDLSGNRTIAARYDNLTITSNGGGALQRAAISGDGTIAVGANIFALTNIPSATPMAGSLLATAIAAPATPAAGKGSLYIDSTSKNLSVKDDAGVIKHGVQTAAAVSHQFLTAINDAGSITLAQPVEGDVVNLTTDLAAKAPVGATFITQTPDVNLTNEQALNALSDGMMTKTAGGVVGTFIAGANRIPTGSGTAGGLTDVDNLKFNGQALGFGSLQEAQVYNASSSATAFAGFRAGTSASFTNNLGFGMTGTNWSGGSLGPNVGLVELNSGSSPLVISNEGTGKISFITTSSRTERMAILNGGDVAITSHLGVGTSSPSYSVDVAVNTAGVDGVRVTNANTASHATLAAYAGTGGGFFRAYGQTFAVSSLANRVGFGNDTGNGGTGVVIFGNSATPSGAAGSISLRGGGYDSGAENLSLIAGDSNFTHGTVTVNGLNGITKATAGVLGNASPSDLAAAQTWPTAPQFLYSGGTATAPVGVSGYDMDTGDHVVTISGGYALALYNLSNRASGNYERMSIGNVGSVYTFTSEKGGTGTARGIKINASTATLALAGSEVRSSTLTGGGFVYTPPGSNGELLNTTPTAEFEYYQEISTASVTTLNAADQYLATSVTGFFGSTQIEYPVAKTLPTFSRVEACLVGPNTINSGVVGVAATANGSQSSQIVFDSTVPAGGCLRSSGTNFGGSASDKVGVQMFQSTGISGRNTATLSGTLRMTIKTRWQGFSTF